MTLKQLDTTILKWIYQRPFSANLAVRGLIFIGDGPFWMLLLLMAAVLGALGPYPAWEALAYQLIVALAVGNTVFAPLKANIKRRRPWANQELQQALGIQIENRDPGHGAKALESFPSGHVMWTTLGVVILINQFAWPAVLLAAWLIPAMIWLRPYLGVHYPSDTLAGLVLGVLVVFPVVYFDAEISQGVELIKDYTGSAFPYIYGVFLLGFLCIGFRAWLKRI